MKKLYLISILLITVTFLGFPENVRADQTPIGSVEIISCDEIKGWAVDLDTPESEIAIYVYRDGTMTTGTLIALLTTSEFRSSINQTYGLTGNHGFYLSLPNTLKDGQQHSVYVYAINNSTISPNTLISGSPQNITCSNGPQTSPGPTVNLKINGVSGPSVCVAPGLNVVGEVSSTNSRTCTMSPAGWKTVNGQNVYGPVNSAVLVSVECVGQGGTASASVQINTNSCGTPVPPPPPPTPHGNPPINPPHQPPPTTPPSSCPLPTTISIYPNNIPSGAVGAVYNTSVTALGGTPSVYAWSIVSGVTPPGTYVTNCSTNICSVAGTPTQAGIYTFGVGAVSNGMFGTKQYTMLINPTNGPTVDLKVNGSDSLVNVASGSNVNLTLTSSNTTSCIVTPFVNLGTSGTSTYSPIATSTIISVLCIGPLGVANDEVIVNVNSCGLITPPATTPPITGIGLGITSNYFRRNDQAKFLVLASYFDGLDAANPTADLDYLKSKGIEGIRIFPNWWNWENISNEDTKYSNNTLFANDGSLRNEQLTKLKQIIGAAANRNMIVDISFARETVFGACTRSRNNITYFMMCEPEYKNAIVSTVTELKNYSNIFYDLQNEFDGDITNLSDASVRDLKNRISSIAPNALLSVSTGVENGLVAVNAANTYGMNLVNAHFTVSEQLSADISKTLSSKPAYIGEPYDSNTLSNNTYSTEDLINGVVRAKQVGIAAWTFHTDAGFILNGTSMEAQLPTNQKNFLNTMSSALAQTNWGIIPSQTTNGLAGNISFSSNLSYGMQNNSAVLALQTLLQQQGLFSGPLTGNFYNITLQAVKNFQTKYGISPVSGFVGPLTRGVLNNL